MALVEKHLPMHFSFEDITKAFLTKTFLRNFVENNSIVLPRKKKKKNHRVMLLSSWETKQQIHENYVDSCKALGIPHVKIDVFKSVCSKTLPFIITPF